MTPRVAHLITYLQKLPLDAEIELDKNIWYEGLSKDDPLRDNPVDCIAQSGLFYWSSRQHKLLINN